MKGGGGKHLSEQVWCSQHYCTNRQDAGDFPTACHYETMFIKDNCVIYIAKNIEVYVYSSGIFVPWYKPFLKLQMRAQEISFAELRGKGGGVCITIEAAHNFTVSTSTLWSGKYRGQFPVILYILNEYK